MCMQKKTYIGKTVCDNIVGFRSRMNQHISDRRAREREFQHVNFPDISISAV